MTGIFLPYGASAFQLVTVLTGGVYCRLRTLVRGTTGVEELALPAGQGLVPTELVVVDALEVGRAVPVLPVVVVLELGARDAGDELGGGFDDDLVVQLRELVDEGVDEAACDGIGVLVFAVGVQVLHDGLVGQVLSEAAPGKGHLPVLQDDVRLGIDDREGAASTELEGRLVQVDGDSGQHC